MLNSFKVVPNFADKPASAICLVAFSFNCMALLLDINNEFGELAMLYIDCQIVTRTLIFAMCLKIVLEFMCKVSVYWQVLSMQLVNDC